jgi:hypothetical protein
MRKILLTAAGAGLLASLLGATSASAERHCYTLGAPGQPHYEYCTFLPIDPSDLIRS